MRVLILGANGQLGSDIVEQFLASQDLKPTPALRSDVDVTDHSRLETYLRDMEYDVLVNCTSYHKTDEAEDNATQAFAVNARAVGIMAQICAEINSKFVHFSTDYVFGGLDITEPVPEAAPTCPVNVYGSSKAMGEYFIKKANCDYYTCRVSSLFGVSGSSGKGGNFIETMINLAKSRDSISVVSDQTMVPTSTQFIAKSVKGLLSNDAQSGVYHVVPNGCASWHDLASHVVEKLDLQCKVKPCSSDEYPTSANRPKYSVLSNAKLRSILGYLPNWEDLADEYLADKGYLSEFGLAGSGR